METIEKNNQSLFMNVVLLKPSNEVLKAIWSPPSPVFSRPAQTDILEQRRGDHIVN